MANLVITKSGNSIIVDFGVYTVSTTLTPMVKASFHVNDLQRIDLFSDHVMVTMHEQQIWKISNVGPTYYIVDSVDGVAPVSLSDLFDKITALR